jgi:maltose alpha-D-glucosyltransferase/alpha-amylase
MGRNARISLEGGLLRFSSTAAFQSLAGDDPTILSVRRSTVESSNTTVLFDDRLFLKGYRRLHWGINPELEMGRFLTDVSPYDHIVPLAGAVEYVAPDGAVATLALLQGYVANQGDAWNYTLNMLVRFLEDCLLQPDTVKEQLDTVHGAFLLLMQILGQRTGELHLALAKETGDPAFDPEPIGMAEVNAWNKRVHTEVARTLERLARQLSGLPSSAQVQAQRLLEAREGVLERIQSLCPQTLQAVKTRYHGDYHLGQVLVAKNDFIIIDFEGEPARILKERRRKHSPLRDIAGMLRSFNYAAHTALGRATTDRPTAREQLKPFVRDWEQRTRAAFMGGYVVAVEGCPIYPQDAGAARTLLELFVLEKAFYELRYELGNRPDWVHVPLGGLSELLLDG